MFGKLPNFSELLVLTDKNTFYHIQVAKSHYMFTSFFSSSTWNFLSVVQPGDIQVSSLQSLQLKGTSYYGISGVSFTALKPLLTPWAVEHGETL